VRQALRSGSYGEEGEEAEDEARGEGKFETGGVQAAKIQRAAYTVKTRVIEKDPTLSFFIDTILPQYSLNITVEYLGRSNVPLQTPVPDQPFTANPSYPLPWALVKMALIFCAFS
jgi:hypothetical protein